MYDNLQGAQSNFVTSPVFAWGIHHMIDAAEEQNSLMRKNTTIKYLHNEVLLQKRNRDDIKKNASLLKLKQSWRV